MANYTISQLGITTTTVVSASNQSVEYQIQSTGDFTITASNGTKNLGNIDISSNSPTSNYFKAKRPVTGLLYPRNVKY